MNMQKALVVNNDVICPVKIDITGFKPTQTKLPVVLQRVTGARYIALCNEHDETDIVFVTRH